MKKIILVIVLVFFVFTIQNLFHSIFSLWQKQELLDSAKAELETERKQNMALKEQLKAVKNPYFIEEQARDRLLLVKPGEQVVVAPDSLIVEKKVLSSEAKREKSNFQLWLELFTITN